MLMLINLKTKSVISTETSYLHSSVHYDENSDIKSGNLIIKSMSEIYSTNNDTLNIIIAFIDDQTYIDAYLHFALTINTHTKLIFTLPHNDHRHLLEILHKIGQKFQNSKIFFSIFGQNCTKAHQNYPMLQICFDPDYSEWKMITSMSKLNKLELIDGKFEKKSNLQGKMLNVVFFPSAKAYLKSEIDTLPITLTSDTETRGNEYHIDLYFGEDAEVLKALSDAMNFSINLVKSSDGEGFGYKVKIVKALNDFFLIFDYLFIRKLFI